MKSSLLYSAMVALLLASCGTKSETTEGGEGMAKTDSVNKQERNKKVAMDMYQGMNNHDANAMMKDCAPDFKDYGDGSMGVMPVDSVKQMISGWFVAFPDFKADNLEYYAEGDKVLVTGDFSGTWKGDMMGMKPTNKSFKMKDVDILTFNDAGKMTEHHNVANWQCVMAMQLGASMPEQKK